MCAHACAAFGREIYVRGRPRVLQATRANIYCARETQSPGSPCRIERARVDRSEARRSTQRRVDMNWVAICDDNSDMVLGAHMFSARTRPMRNREHIDEWTLTTNNDTSNIA